MNLLQLPPNNILISNLPTITNATSIPSLKPTITTNSSSSILSTRIAQKKQQDLLSRAKRREDLIPNLKIESFRIKYYSYEELKSSSVVEINQELKTSNSIKDTDLESVNALLNTVMDPRMGVYSDIRICSTCGQNTINCPGHHGFIELAKKILHPEGIEFIIKILESICNDCSDLLLDFNTIEKRGIMKKTGKTRLYALADLSKGLKCSRKHTSGNCENPKFSSKKTNDQNSGKIIAKYKHQGLETDVVYTADDVYQKFDSLNPKVEGFEKTGIKVENETVYILGFDNGAHPRNLVLQSLYVVPTISRPPSIRDGNVKLHDLTEMYNNIVKCNNLLKRKVEQNLIYNEKKTEYELKIRNLENFANLDESEKNNIMEILELEIKTSKIQQQRKKKTEDLEDYKNYRLRINKYKSELNKVTIERNKEKNSENDKKDNNEDDLYINLYNAVQHLMDNTSEAYTSRGDKSYKSIKEHINGKDEIVRGLLMGKRVNFAGRSVLSPDPSLKFGQIRVPRIIGDKLTKKVKVFKTNLKYCRQLFIDNKIVYYTAGDGDKKGIRMSVTPNNKDKITIKIGDLIERKLQNGDYVLFNRQPSIHKESMLGYEVVLSDLKTIGLHPSVCVAHNADFDGDEGNLHVLQTVGADIETVRIANSKECIMSSQSNKNMMNVHMDPVQASYSMTKDKDSIIDDDCYYDCIGLLTETSQIPTLDDRLQKYSVLPKTGPALFSATLPEDLFYTKGDVRIVEGILIAGKITKDHLGNSSNSLIETVYKEYGTERASSLITDISYLGNRYILDYPFSVKYSDCIIEEESYHELVQNKIKTARIAVNAIERKRELRERKEKILGLKANELETQKEEAEIISILNSTRNIGAKVANEYLGPNNGLAISAFSKVKGDVFNVAQITSIVGQQFINGARLEKTMTNNTRCSPYFAPGDTSIEAQGFCTGNFFKGLSPAEQFFLQTGSRENTVESIIKVPTSGDINHRMAKNFEDIIIANNGNVVNSRDKIYQFAYEDGFSTKEMIFVNSKLGRVLSPMNFKNIADKLNVKYGYLPQNISYKK